MLVGDNARRFALREGFAEEDLLTDAARARFAAWQTQQTQPDGHDTIGVCALDARGDLAAACSTSGLAWKAPGRVGDSPIIGSGLYVDNEVGAAVATGNGDEIIRVCLASRVVIEMEWGASPQEACEEAVRYLLRKRPGHQERGAACLALGRDGRVGGAATHTGFSPPARVWEYALATADGEPRILEGVYVR
jgi:isoaspartyl peptidase/L-asparaginase-like protein (Ntn-hydrolase superfamily)